MRPEYIFHSWYHPGTNPLSAQSSSLPQPSIGKARALDQAGLLHIQINPIPARQLLSKMRLSSQAIG